MSKKKLIGRYANNTSLSYGQRAVILSALTCNISEEKIKVVAKPEFSVDQMQEILAGFYSGLRIDKVKLYANSAISPSEMRMIRWAFKVGTKKDKEEAMEKIALITLGA